MRRSAFYVLYLFIAGPAWAGTVPLQNPLQAGDIPTLAGTIIKAALGIIGSIALLMFIWGGFLWLTARGNPETIKKGKGTLIWAVIGLAFIFSAYIIANFIIRGLTGQS